MTTDGTPLHYLTIGQASRLIQQREVSPVELVEAYLRRIDEIDGTLKAYVTVVADQALADARAAETEIAGGNYRGPLHGVPIGLKDLYDTAGVRTTGQSKVLEHRVPAKDATSVAKLRGAGTILLGKLSMHEFALGGPDTSLFELSRNPWDTERGPGGSSSGSGTAVAAGLCMAALGSDTGGSIRIPAAYCGIVGLKPTYGRVSRAGVLPLAWSLDHCGPMTWTVEDAALMLQAMAGPDPADPTAVDAPVPDYSAALADDVRGLTIGVPRSYIDDPAVGVDPEVGAAFDAALAALASLGARIEEIEVPSLAFATEANTMIMISEAFSYHRANLISQPQNYGATARACFVLGGTYTTGDYQQAMRARARVRREYAEVMQRVDLIATPSMATPAGPFDYDLLSLIGIPNFMGPMNQTGMPAISVPCGFSDDGLPIGLQLAGRPFDEPTVIRAAHAYQQQAGLLDRRPGY